MHRMDEADVKVMSFVGDTWVTTRPDGSVMRTIKLEASAGRAQRIEVGTGKVTLSGPAVAAAEESEEVWGQEVDLGDGYGFEFSPSKVAAERRVTLLAVTAAEVDRGSDDTAAVTARFGLVLAANGTIERLDPNSLVGAGFSHRDAAVRLLFAARDSSVGCDTLA